MHTQGGGQRYSKGSVSRSGTASAGRGAGRGSGVKSGNTGTRGGHQKGTQFRSRNYQTAVRCTVESCRSRMNEGRKLFYPIPTPAGTRKIWTDLIRRHNLSSGSVFTNYICSDHFSANQKLPNGHLKGNAVPNIFNVQRRGIVDCLYCGTSFQNRGRLHSHDSTMHLHESRRWKLECETEYVSPKSLHDGKSNCKECETRIEVLKQMDALRQNVQQATIELGDFARTYLSGRIQLDLPPLSDDIFSLSDDNFEISNHEKETSPKID